MEGSIIAEKHTF